ncbi:folliculin domain-containing protein [Planctomonas sp. JC2975]|nr:folliculin domain-containing protein [Planctomonas sp. JC2975]
MAHDAASVLHIDAPTLIGDAPPMFFFDDPFGNVLAYIQED